MTYAFITTLLKFDAPFFGFWAGIRWGGLRTHADCPTWQPSRQRLLGLCCLMGKRCGGGQAYSSVYTVCGASW